MFKNVASQKIELFFFDYSTGAPKTGDSANLTAYVTIDHGTTTVLGDTSATEKSSTNAPGVYVFDLTQAETNGDNLTFTGKSSTSNVACVPRIGIQTLPTTGILAPGTLGHTLTLNGSGKVSGVVLTDTVTTYTGNTVQTGDGYGILNNGTYGLSALKTLIDTITNRIGAFTGSGVNTILGFFKALLKSDASNPSDVGGTFDPSTDSTQALRDRGDAAWITATGFATPTNVTDARDSIKGSGTPSIADVKAKTDLIPASPAAVGSAMTLTSAYDFAKGTVAVTEAYASNGAAPTPVQAIMAIHQVLMQFAISGTSITVKKLDNSTTAFVVTLDDDTTPTGAART